MAFVVTSPQTALTKGGPASFMGSTSSYGNDTNGDGVYEYLTVAFQVQVTTPGDFLITGQLYGSHPLSMNNDENLTYVFSTVVSIRSVEKVLGVGTYPMTLSFRPYMIYNSNLTIPWNIDLSLYNYATMALLDSQTHTTSSYDPARFVPPGLKIGSITYWEGYDLNGDNYFDTLDVHVSFHLYRAGNYSLKAGLYDHTDTQLFDLDYQAGTYSFNPTTVVFHFNVTAYSSSSGPYPMTIIVRDDQSEWTEIPLRDWEEYWVDIATLLLPLTGFGV